jgi:putative endonuclease
MSPVDRSDGRRCVAPFQPGDRRALGAEGEARAAALLEERGYRILARNARAGGVEIDLVAQRASLIAFVEVKTRRTRRFGSPELAVDARKRARLVRGAAAWLRENRRRARSARFDVIACEFDAHAGWRLRHIEGAFDASE